MPSVTCGVYCIYSRYESGLGRRFNCRSTRGSCPVAAPSVQNLAERQTQPSVRGPRRCYLCDSRRKAKLSSEARRWRNGQVRAAGKKAPMFADMSSQGRATSGLWAFCPSVRSWCDSSETSLYRAPLAKRNHLVLLSTSHRALPIVISSSRHLVFSYLVNWQGAKP